MRSLLAALPHLRETAPFRILYVPDKPAGVEALESFQRHNADAIIFVHGFSGKILKYCYWDNCRHGIVIYRQKETGAPVTLLAVDEKAVAPVAAGRLQKSVKSLVHKNPSTIIIRKTKSKVRPFVQKVFSHLPAATWARASGNDKCHGGSHGQNDAKSFFHGIFSLVL